MKPVFRKILPVGVAKIFAAGMHSVLASNGDDVF